MTDLVGRSFVHCRAAQVRGITALTVRKPLRSLGTLYGILIIGMDIERSARE